MNNQESEKLEKALQEQGFDEHDRKVIYAILSARGKFCQEDILNIEPKYLNQFAMLGWFEKVATAFKNAGLKLSITN